MGFTSLVSVFTEKNFVACLVGGQRIDCSRFFSNALNPQDIRTAPNNGTGLFDFSLELGCLRSHGDRLVGLAFRRRSQSIPSEM